MCTSILQGRGALSSEDIIKLIDQIRPVIQISFDMNTRINWIKFGLFYYRFRQTVQLVYGGFQIGPWIIVQLLDEPLNSATHFSLLVDCCTHNDDLAEPAEQHL